MHPLRSPLRPSLRRPGRWVTTAIGVWLIAGCASAGARAARSGVLTTKPVVRRESVAWHIADVMVFSQMERSLDVPRLARRLAGHPAPSADLIDGHVDDDSFFTNRDIRAMSVEDIRRGPTVIGQTPTPPFVVTRIKDEGKTAGFFVKDAKGDRYLFKADPAAYPEILSGAEVATSKLLYALGYFVPSYEIVEVRADDLRLGPKVKADELEELVTRHLSGGPLRVSASRLVDGEVLGPIRFKQYRHLAELRALKLAYAWVNDTDTKDHNSLMVWTGARAIGYLIDFGSSFGASAGHGPKSPCQGWSYDVDLKDWTFEALTLGLYHTGCDRRERPFSPAVGLFSPRLDPRHWKPYVPNLAFDEMTRKDGAWMAQRIAMFSRAQLESAVAAGRYHRAQDAARIIEVLEARRAAILRSYLP